MISKPMYKMKKLIGLCLLMTTAIETITGHATTKTVAEHEIQVQIMVAPQMLDDQKFATLTFRTTFPPNQREISVKVVGPNYDGRKCILPLSVNPAAINRVSRKTVVLIIYAVNENWSEMPLRLLLVNTNDCTMHYAYDGVLPRWRSYTFTSTNSSDERFAMIVYGKRYCGDTEWCRLHFDPIYQKREALDFDFSREEFEGIELATESFDANLFVVYVGDPKTNLTSLRLYDLSSNRTGPSFTVLLVRPTRRTYLTTDKSVKTMPNSSGLSYCLPVSRLINDDDQQCVRFGEDGTVMFNETIPIKGIVLYPSTVRNGMILFSTGSGCFAAKWCKTVQVTVVTRDSDSKKGVQMQRREYRHKCKFMPEALNVKLNEITNKIQYFEYLCEDDSHVSSRVIYEH